MARTGRSLRVLPDGARVEEAMLHAAAQGRGFVDGSGFASFGQLLEMLGGARSLGRRPCGPATARVVLWAAAKKLGGGPFGAFVQEPAFARAALDLVFELKSGGLSPAGFREAVDRFPASRIDRARHLARIYEEYEVRLAHLQLADREDATRGALECLRRNGLPPELRAFGQIELQGLYDFPWSRRELVLELAVQCDRAGLAFRVEVPGGLSAEVDGAVDPFLSELERRAQTLTRVEAGKRDLSLEGRPLGHLGRFLFAGTSPDPLEVGEVPLELLRAATARQEARLLARIARDRIASGVAPERIAIAYPDLGEEAEWVVEALEELGIPARIRRGMPLQATAAGRVALELPLLVDDGFPAEDVARLVSSRYLPELSTGAPESPASILALASVRDDRLGAEAGRGAYDVRLNALIRRLEGRGEGRGESARALLERCRKLIAIAGQIPEEGKAGELLDRWWNALDELGLSRAVRQPELRGAEGTGIGRAVLRALARDQAAYEALRAMATELRSALRDSGAASGRMTRRTFHRWLFDAARDFNLTPRGPRGGAVHVLDVRELSDRTFDHVCLGGLVDGRFPGRDTPHPLFPDEDRIRVNAWHKRDVFRVGTGEAERRIPWRLAADRLLLYLALSATEDRVTVSHASESSGGVEQTPSPFWDELVRLTAVKPRHAPLQAIASLDEVRTEGELRERVALELYAPVPLRTSDPDPAGERVAQAIGAEPWLEEAGLASRIESERLRFFGEEGAEVGPWSGLARTEVNRDALAQCFEFGRERPLSASTLQKFGNCAFQGFLAFALRLDEPDEPGEEMDNRGQGNFWHKVLEVLFPELKARGLLGAPVDDVPDDVIDQALAKAAEDAERSGHVGHPALWKLGRERGRRMVRRVLASESRGLPFHFLEPTHTELRFGSAAAEEAWREVAIPSPDGAPPVYVEGKIDRIDTGNGMLGVVDYKSGSVKRAGQLLDALLVTEFQLPLYLFAARRAGHQGPLKAAWLSLKDGDPVDLEVELAKHQLSFDELLSTDPETIARVEKEGLKNLSLEVHKLVGGLREGRFPARPEDCGFCPYQRVCRISERRMPEGGA